MTAVMVACQKGTVAVVQYLVEEAGARLDMKTRVSVDNAAFLYI